MNVIFPPCFQFFTYFSFSFLYKNAIRFVYIRINNIVNFFFVILALHSIVTDQMNQINFSVKMIAGVDFDFDFFFWYGFFYAFKI